MGAGRHFASGEAARNEGASPPGFPRLDCSLQSRRAGFDSFAHWRDKLAGGLTEKGMLAVYLDTSLRAELATM